MVNARAIRQRDAQWSRLQSGVTIREELEVPDETILFADSGGFDFQGNEIDISSKETLETQEHIDADILGTVDLPLSRQNRTEVNQQRIEQGVQYALEASDLYEGRGLLFASVHGYDPQNIRNEIKYLEQHGDFAGYAIGSLVPIRTDYEKVTKIILAARQATEKHLHVYGLGGLVYLPLLLYLGVDSFDSSAYIQSAGLRYYFIPGFGGERLADIENIDYLPCCCPICGPRTLEEVRKDRNLLTEHNLWALVSELRRFRYIAEVNGDVESYLDLRFQGNPVTKRAFKIARQQVRGLA
jgi:tRNA-guanine family transglycosylase